MKKSQKIRKFLGLPPRIGDEVAGGLDFGVSYIGVVKEMGLYATIDGVTTIRTEWRGSVQQKNDTILVPINRLRHK